MINIRYDLFENISEKLIEEQFFKDNYLIEESNENSNLAVVYFSSNGIYYPNEASVFITEIIEKNKFEFYKHRVKKAKKHIFIRDSLKQFYVNGINIKINTVDKLVEFLAKETEGMDLITIGSSSGGYMALLAGIKLNARQIFTFSPIVNFYKDFESVEQMLGQKNLYAFKDIEEYSKNYDISALINNSNVPIVYFYAYYNDLDQRQLHCLDKTKQNICIFPLKTKDHGDNLKSESLNGFLNSSFNFIKQIRKLYRGKILSKNKLNKIFLIKNYINYFKK